MDVLLFHLPPCCTCSHMYLLKSMRSRAAREASRGIGSKAGGTAFLANPREPLIF